MCQNESQKRESSTLAAHTCGFVFHRDIHARAVGPKPTTA